jgi:hypothetical protein
VRAVPYKALREKVESLKPLLTPAFVEEAVRSLMRQGEDVGGGVNAMRLVKHWLGESPLRDVEIVWVYDHLKPALRAALAQVPSLDYFEGD